VPENLPARRTAPRSRAELERPYRHPYRAAALAAAGERRGAAALSGVLLAGGTIGALAASPLLWLTAAVGALLAVAFAIALAWVTVRDGTTALRRGRRRSELGAVLAARPHAGEADRDVVHDAFAVTVEDDGRLLTWRFRPLGVDERVHEDLDDEIEVPGRPRPAASIGAPPGCAAGAAPPPAEQLVEAQERAADRERAAADAAGRGELAIEARTTAAALRSATGQDARPRRRSRPRS
jgi:hypothetical protein